MMVKIVTTEGETSNSGEGVTLVVDTRTGEIYEYYYSLKANWYLEKRQEKSEKAEEVALLGDAN